MSRLSIPSSSLAPNRPQALPLGPSFWRGREENSGVVGDISGMARLRVEMELKLLGWGDVKKTREMVSI